MRLRRLAPTMVAAAIVFGPALAAGAEGYTSLDTGTVTDTTPNPGQQVTVEITGLQPYSTVVVELHSTPVVLGTFTADATGTLRVPVTIPASAPLGSHTIVATGMSPSGTPVTASIPVMVTSTTATTTPGGTGGTGGSGGTGVTFLPRTGADFAALLTVGGALVIAGGAAVRTARRHTADTD